MKMANESFIWHVLVNLLYLLYWTLKAIKPNNLKDGLRVSRNPKDGSDKGDKPFTFELQKIWGVELAHMEGHEKIQLSHLGFLKNAAT